VKLSYDAFSKKLDELGVSYENEVSCPRKQNQVCLQNYSSCLKGKENDCCQRLQFSIGKKFFNIEVVFWGENRKGVINTESLSVRNFVEKAQIDLKSL